MFTFMFLFFTHEKSKALMFLANKIKGFDVLCSYFFELQSLYVLIWQCSYLKNRVYIFPILPNHFMIWIKISINPWRPFQITPKEVHKCVSYPTSDKNYGMEPIYKILVPNHFVIQIKISTNPWRHFQMAPKEVHNGFDILHRIKTMAWSRFTKFGFSTFTRFVILDPRFPKEPP